MPTTTGASAAYASTSMARWWPMASLTPGIHRARQTASTRFELVVTDCAGNTTRAKVKFEVDNTAPGQPYTLGAQSPGLGGAFSELLLEGLAEDNATLHLYVREPGENSLVLVGTVQADKCGYWSYPYEFSALGEHVFQIVAEDAAGNQSWGDELALMLDPSLALQTVMLREGLYGYTGAADTWLDATESTTTHGADPTLSVGDSARRVALLRFDLSSIAEGAEVRSASLGIWTAPGSSGELAVGAYELKHSWAEAEASYNLPGRSTKWDEPGAAGLDDRTMRPESVTQLEDEATWYGLGVTEIAQEWLNDAEANNGMLLAGSALDESTYGIAASEYPEECRRPVLYVIYALPKTY